MNLNRLRQQFWIRKNARAIKKHYLRWPYRLYKVNEFDGFNHEHTCLATRFPNIDLSEICPLKDKRGLIPGDRDECEMCRYFGIIRYQQNAQTGEKEIHLEMSGAVVSLFEERDW